MKTLNLRIFLPYEKHSSRGFLSHDPCGDTQNATATGVCVCVCTQNATATGVCVCVCVCVSKHMLRNTGAEQEIFLIWR